MSADHAAFVGSIPENYDRYLGPVLFEPYATDLAQRLTVPADGMVLELACGTGILTRRLRDRLPPTAKIVATDLNEAMLNYAAQKFRPEENVELKQADALDLPFVDQSFDAVVCQFGLMFVPDKELVAREVYRVLKPGRTFLFNVWDEIERNGLAHTAHTTVAKYFADNPPDFYQVPFSFHDAQAIRRLLSSVGFSEIQVTPLALTSKGNSAREVAKGLIHGNPIIAALRERCESKIPEIEADLANVVASKFGDEPVRARMHALICAAVRANAD